MVHVQIKYIFNEIGIHVKLTLPTILLMNEYYFEHNVNGISILNTELNFLDIKSFL